MDRFAGEIAALDAMGYDDREKLAALGGRLYVRSWAHCPRWMEWVDKLPPPLKWRDGVTYKRKKQIQIKSIIYRDTLFLQYPYCEPAGTKLGEKIVLVIHDLERRTLPELIEGLPNGQRAEWALTEIARARGLQLSSVVPVLRCHAVKEVDKNVIKK